MPSSNKIIRLPANAAVTAGTKAAFLALCPGYPAWTFAGRPAELRPFVIKS